MNGTAPPVVRQGEHSGIFLVLKRPKRVRFRTLFLPPPAGPTIYFGPGKKRRGFIVEL
jgi:hypothetical protein